MTIPILGSATASIPAQTRLNVAAIVDETIKAVPPGLSIARLKLTMPLESNDVTYPLALEEFERRGCVLVAVNEMAVPLPQGAIVLVSIVFRMPKPAPS